MRARRATGRERRRFGVVVALAVAACGGEPPSPSVAEVPERAAPLPEAALVERHELAERPAAPDGARSAVVVLLAGVQPEWLEPYGAAWGRTPFVGLLGRQGVVLAPLPPDTGWLASWPASLQRAGYRTYAVMADPALPGDRFANGFDHFRNAQPHGLQMRSRLRARQTADMAFALVRRHRAAHPQVPYLLVVSFVDGVPPYRVPPEDLRTLRERYPNHDPEVLGAVRQVDDAAQRLVDALTRLDAASPPIVVVAGELSRNTTGVPVVISGVSAPERAPRTLAEVPALLQTSMFRAGHASEDPEGPSSSGPEGAPRDRE